MIHIYYRVSTDKQDFGMQDTAIRNTLKSKCIDYDLCKVYKDFGISGTTTQRLGYQELLSNIRKDDTIVVYEISRLWRDMEEQTRATKLFRKSNISVLSAAEGENATHDKFMTRVRGLVNEFEADWLRERTLAGIKAKKERVAAGQDIWKPRGQDKQPRRKEGYLKRWQKQKVQ
jgi:DNA invertase Pin-like site-specific DNA recombinase